MRLETSSPARMIQRVCKKPQATYFAEVGPRTHDSRREIRDYAQEPP